MKLLVDLTKYDKLYEKGIVGDCDMVPIRHPNIHWQNCYVLRYQGHELVVGEDGLEPVPGEISPEELQRVTEAQAIFTAQKLSLIELVKNGAIPVIQMKDKTIPTKWWLFEFNPNRKVQELTWEMYGEDRIPFAPILFEYVTQENLSRIELSKKKKNAPYEVRLFKKDHSTSTSFCSTDEPELVNRLIKLIEYYY